MDVFSKGPLLQFTPQMVGISHNTIHLKISGLCLLLHTSTDYGRLFSLKSRTFGPGQTNWADKFWGNWGIFRQNISTHFGTVSPLYMFFIIQPLFLHKLSFYINIPSIYLGLEFKFWP